MKLIADKIKQIFNKQFEGETRIKFKIEEKDVEVVIYDVEETDEDVNGDPIEFEFLMMVKENGEIIMDKAFDSNDLTDKIFLAGIPENAEETTED